MHRWRDIKHFPPCDSSSTFRNKQKMTMKLEAKTKTTLRRHWNSLSSLHGSSSAPPFSSSHSSPVLAGIKPHNLCRKYNRSRKCLSSHNSIPRAHNHCISLALSLYTQNAKCCTPLCDLLFSCFAVAAYSSTTRRTTTPLVLSRSNTRSEPLYPLSLGPR